MSKMNMAYKYEAKYESKYESKYDLNKYRKLENEELPDSENEKRDITHKKKNIDKGTAIKITVIAFITTLLLFTVIYSKVQVSAIYSQINERKSVLASEESENARLKAKIESYTSLKNIEEYAEEHGLTKLDKAQIWYVEVQSDDVVVIPENDDNIFIKLKKQFRLLGEYFSG